MDVLNFPLLFHHRKLLHNKCSTQLQHLFWTLKKNTATQLTWDSCCDHMDSACWIQCPQEQLTQLQKMIVLLLKCWIFANPLVGLLIPGLLLFWLYMKICTRALKCSCILFGVRFITWQPTGPAYDCLDFLDSSCSATAPFPWVIFWLYCACTFNWLCFIKIFFILCVGAGTRGSLPYPGGGIFSTRVLWVFSPILV